MVEVRLLVMCQDVTAIAPEPHVIYHYSIFTMFENDKTGERTGHLDDSKRHVLRSKR